MWTHPFFSDPGSVPEAGLHMPELFFSASRCGLGVDVGGSHELNLEKRERQ